MRPICLTFALVSAAWLAACGPAAPPPPPSAASAAAASSAATRFTADGSSPAWQARLDGDSLTFDVPDVAGPDTPPRTISVARQAHGQGGRFDGQDGATAVSLNVDGTPCTRTGIERPFTATLTYGDHTYHGCADALR